MKHEYWLESMDWFKNGKSIKQLFIKTNIQFKESAIGYYIGDSDEYLFYKEKPIVIDCKDRKEYSYFEFFFNQPNRLYSEALNQLGERRIYQNNIVPINKYFNNIDITPYPYKNNILDKKSGGNPYFTLNYELICRMLTDDNNYDLIAPTGSGKTKSIITMAKEKNLYMIIFAPNTINPKQMEIEYNILGIYESIQPEAINQGIQKHRVIASTYNGISKILKSDARLENYILVIDEYHNFITQTNIRKTEIRMIISNMFRFKKNIRVTGTPEGVLSADENRKIIFFTETERKPFCRDGYYILSYKKDGLSVMISHIIASDYKKKIVIFMNDIESFDMIKKALVENHIFSESVEILYAGNKNDSREYGSIINNKMLQKKTKVLITTSVISDGVNILNDDIEALYIYDIKDITLIRQFMARFRRGFSKCYDFIPGTNDTDEKNWISFEDQLKILKKMYQQNIDAMNEITFGLDAHSIKLISDICNKANSYYLKNKMVNIIYYNKDEECFYFDEQTLRHHILDKFYNSLFVYKKDRATILKLYENINVEISDVNQQTCDSLEDSSTLKEEAIRDLIDFLIKHFNEVIGVNRKRIGADIIEYYKNKYNFELIESKQAKTFKFENKEILTNPLTHKRFQNFFLMLKYRLPMDICAKSVGLNMNYLNKLIRRLIIYKYTYIYMYEQYRIYFNPQSLYDGSNKHNRSYDPFIIDFIISYCHNNSEKFYPKVFANALNSHLITRAKSVLLKDRAYTKIFHDVFFWESRTQDRKRKTFVYKNIQFLSLEKILQEANIQQPDIKSLKTCLHTQIVDEVMNSLRKSFPDGNLPAGIESKDISELETMREKYFIKMKNKKTAENKSKR